MLPSLQHALLRRSSGGLRRASAHQGNKNLTKNGCFYCTSGGDVEIRPGRATLSTDALANAITVTTTSKKKPIHRRTRTHSPIRGVATTATTNGCYNPNVACPLKNDRYRWLSSSTNEVTTILDEEECESDASGVPSRKQSPCSSMNELLSEVQLDRATVEHLASQRPTPLKLKDMYSYGSNPHARLITAQFLYKELPVRIAQRTMDLLTLPHGLSQATPIQQVARIYLGFLKRMMDFPFPETKQQEILFTDMLQAFILDRASIPVRIAQGVNAWWQKASTAGNGELHLQEMEEALERFFTARVGLRFLTEHYVLSSPRRDEAAAQTLRRITSMFPVTSFAGENKDSNNSNNDTVGCIQANCNVAQEIRRVADLVAQQTKVYYDGLCPAIEIVDCCRDMQQQPFTYVPQHLHYMLAELLKNSCRASMRKYKESLDDATEHPPEIPSIRVILVKGEEDVTIKVADKGGGIPRSLMATIWKFAHSTASEDEVDTEFGRDAASGAKIRGFGLPLARIYARYFGGDLTLKSTEGYGVDAYLHLPRLGQACEHLPLRVRDSPGERDSMPVTKAAAGGSQASHNSTGDGKRFFSSSTPIEAASSRQHTMKVPAAELKTTPFMAL